MANQSTDQQILQLIQIKLGLEQKSQKIFRQLLQDGKKDPLDQLFKSIVTKNRKIESLKLELQKSRAQIDRLQTKINPNYKSTTNANQVRSKSLPDQHESKMKSIGEDKRKVESDRNKYRQKVESFIVFLMKCIREISRVDHDGLDSKGGTQINSKKIDPDQIQKRIQKQIKKHQQLFFQTQIQREAQTKSVASVNTFMTGTTRASTESTNMEKKQKQDLHRLIKQIKGKLKQPEQMFQKIHKALGLQQEWKDYIGKLKSQINSFRQFKQFARVEEQKIQQQQQDQQIGFSLRQQMKNQQKWRKNQQAQKSQQNNYRSRNQEQQNVQPAKKFNINLWNIDVYKISQKINYEQQQRRLETLFSQTLKTTDRQLNQLITHFQKTLNSTVSKIFQLLDALLGKHNQHPFSNKKSHANNGHFGKQINCQQFMRNGKWKEVDDMIFKEVQDRLKFIERRVKFYSANRCVLRNQAPL